MFARIHLKRVSIFAVTMLLIAGVWGSVWAQTDDELIPIFEASIEAFNAHDLDQLMSYWTDDVVYDFVPIPFPMNGKEQVAAFIGGVLERFPEFHATPTLVLVTGHTLVAEYAIATGSGQINVMHIIAFEGDKAKQYTEYLNYAPPPELPPLEASFELPASEGTGLGSMETAMEIANSWNAHDLVSHAKLYHQDADILLVPLFVPLTRDALIGAFELYFLGLSDLAQEIVNSIDLGDGWVVVEAIARGTNDGPYFGLPATNNHMENRLAWIVHIDEEGLCTYFHAYWDERTTLNQLFPPVSVQSTTWGQVKSLFQE